MAVMRWKCSLLTPDELATLHDWINGQRALKEKTRALPWSEEAIEHGDSCGPHFLRQNPYNSGQTRHKNGGNDK